MQEKAFFQTSLDHILAELTRLDLFLHVQMWRMRFLQPDENEVLHHFIPNEEAEARLANPPGRPLWASVTLPDDFNQDVAASLTAMAQQIERLKAESAAQGIELRLETLVERFQLHPFERDVVLLCLAPALDLGYRRLYAYLQEDSGQLYPTVSLMLELICPDVASRVASQRLLSQGAPLLRQQMIAATPPPGGQAAPTLAYQLRLDERIYRYLLDSDELDPLLRPYVTARPDEVALADTPLTASEQARLSTIATGEAQQCFYLQGAAGIGREKTAVALANLRQQSLLVVDCQRLLTVPVEQLSALVRRIVREATLQNGILYWADFDAMLETKMAQQCTLVLEAVATADLVIFGGERDWQPTPRQLSCSYYPIRLHLPTASEREQLWRQSLNGSAAQGEIDITAVATQFRLTGQQIASAATMARTLARWRNPQEARVETADLFTASRRHSNQNLAVLAQQIQPHYRWNDIVLPAEQTAQLRQLLAQVKHRAVVFEEWGFEQRLALGRGVTALFTGQPGTGKTMAADILAGELDLDLYKIDLASVVSKYIGETEKNLAQIFDEAESSNAILFFDEADALFGKRTEVKDSHDRYANLEISYLLQKMDEYEGIVILATNFRENLDDAFVRRIRFIVEFPLPSAIDRRRIWEGIWPSRNLLAADVDLSLLAEQLDVSGGVIRNIGLAAAFLAAAEVPATTPPIQKRHLMAAAIAEYRKIGRFVPHSLQLEAV